MRALSRSASSAGFTLLELLVVVVIIGIIAAMATLGIGTSTRDRESRREAERLDSLLHVATEEAQMQGRQLGLTVFAHEYRFSTMDPDTGQWAQLADAEMFQPHVFTPDTIVNLEVEGHLIRLAEEPSLTQGRPASANPSMDAQKKPPDEMNAEGPPPPQIFILSSGEITPFTLRLKSGQGRPGFQVRVAANGEIRSVPDDT